MLTFLLVVSRHRHCIPIDIYYTTHVLVFDNTVYVYNILTTPLYLYQRIAQRNIYSQRMYNFNLRRNDNDKAAGDDFFNTRYISAAEATYGLF
jgi:hypothetical protein